MGWKMLNLFKKLKKNKIERLCVMAEPVFIVRARYLENWMSLVDLAEPKSVKKILYVQKDEINGVVRVHFTGSFDKPLDLRMYETALVC